MLLPVPPILAFSFGKRLFYLNIPPILYNHSMKKLLITASILLVIFSISFIIFDILGYVENDYMQAKLEDFSGTQDNLYLFAGLIITLLAIDLFLPIPSSIIMVLSGVVLGTFWGAIASFIGAILSAIIGFGLCRRLGQKAFDRFIGTEDTENIKKWFNDYGLLAIIISRPVPMLTEILSCLAGLSHIKFLPFIIASTLGTLPICFIYSYAGSSGKDATTFAVLIALVIPALGWIITKKIKGSSENQS